jgi:hypothetical protein
MRPAGGKRGKSRLSQVFCHASAPWGGKHLLAGDGVYGSSRVAQTRGAGGCVILQSGVGSGHLCTDSLTVYIGAGTTSAVWY